MRFVTIILLNISALYWTLNAAQGLTCEVHNETSGSIYDSQRIYFEEIYTGCWTVVVPQNHYARLTLSELYFSDRDCKHVYLNITDIGTRELFHFCSGVSSDVPITVLGNATIIHYVYSYMWSSTYISSRFRLSFHIESLICTQEDSFRCSAHSCVHSYQVCDGVRHCENGADEIGCEPNEREQSRKKAISWLKSKRNQYQGWAEETHRAIVALYLSGATNFTTGKADEELLVKELELETAVMILRNQSKAVTTNELSMFINALLATCHNPRQFYGYDLVKVLKDHVAYFEKIPHPAAYLALCNANETIPDGVHGKIKDLLETGAGYPSLTDVQAMAVTAVSCLMGSRKNIDHMISNTDLMDLYEETVEKLKSSQHNDGSFGSIYTTALVSQALIAAEGWTSTNWDTNGEEWDINGTIWNINATLKYLMQQVNSTSANFLSVYLTLPVLNLKSLANIAKINCTGRMRKLGDVDDISGIKDKVGPKMQIQYSLYVGDEKDAIHTIYLKIVENSTALQLMELAAKSDPKYKFKSHHVTDIVQVYEILDIPNDPEHAKFWILYVIHPGDKENLVQPLEGPDNLVLRDGDHLILWYKAFGA